jgi:antitoxin (DNA-binding transcriptional repressor) of toxin-antitoxin stability system
MMHHMKTATVRDLRYSFSRIAKWLKAGESIEVTYRGKKLARLIPAGRAVATPPEPPDFEARLQSLFPQGIKGKPASRIIVEERGRT